MLFKRKRSLVREPNHGAKIAETIRAKRLAISCGLDLERMFRLLIEAAFDCKVPSTLSPAEFIANAAEIDVELLHRAISNMVAGDNPAKYRWLGIKDLQAFYSMVAVLYLLNENSSDCPSASTTSSAA